MNRVFAVGLFIVLLGSGYLVINFVSENKDIIFKKDRLTVGDIVNNVSVYLDQEVQLRGKVLKHSSRDWVILEEEGERIFVKHNIRDAYFKYGEKYQVRGEVKFGEVFGVEEDVVYINALEEMIRNNTIEWI
ncbi:hypothetical protein KY345_02150 [Candidatus Woesearchaeota archaeon]|nr:hypothetical protein [Candidatus Woesearchaeota archaeon]